MSSASLHAGPFPCGFALRNGSPLAFCEAAAAIDPASAELDLAADALLHPAPLGKGPSALILAAPHAGRLTPEDEARCQALLPAAMKRRLAAFSNLRRREQSLRVRLLALVLASRILERKPALELREEPPYGPVLFDAAAGRAAAWLTLAHCPGSSAAALSLRPMGIDIEQPRPVARLAAVAAYAYGDDAGQAFASWSQTVPSQEAEEAFFALWGAKEGEVKINRGASGSLRRAQVRIAPSAGLQHAPWRLEALDAEGGDVPLHFFHAAGSFVTTLGPESRLTPGAPAAFALSAEGATPAALLDALESRLCCRRR